MYQPLITAIATLTRLHVVGTRESELEDIGDPHRPRRHECRRDWCCRPRTGDDLVVAQMPLGRGREDLHDVVRSRRSLS
jgi:hypothetical protein